MVQASMKGKLNGISLFSGYGGIDLALSEYVRPILYCEIEKYVQGVLISRMDDGSLPFAPIWTDVTTMDGNKFRGLVDIICGGFPCQDISVAGKGAGLEGKRSGLFYEVARLCEEISPLFVFLENVPAIRTRGSIEVQEKLASLGYDCRFGVLSAAEVGANHKRERWFCLGVKRDAANAESSNDRFTFALENKRQIQQPGIGIVSTNVADSMCERLEGYGILRSTSQEKREALGFFTDVGNSLKADWWATEPDVGRMAHGTKFRSHRIKALGNGVVPAQVKTAFEILMGIAQ